MWPQQQLLLLKKRRKGRQLPELQLLPKMLLLLVGGDTVPPGREWGAGAGAGEKLDTPRLPGQDDLHHLQQRKQGLRGANRVLSEASKRRWPRRI
jgi:hypothetical protein